MLGQMQDSQAVAVLQRVLRAGHENAMVRHEAAEALGSIASDECIGMLHEHACDAEPIVAHSCEVRAVHPAVLVFTLATRLRWICWRLSRLVGLITWMWRRCSRRYERP